MSFLRSKLNLFLHWYYIISGKTAVDSIQKEGLIYSIHEVKGYYNDLTKKIGTGTELDESNIPISLLPNKEKVYFPIAVFNYGLACYDMWLLKNAPLFYDQFIAISDWAVKNQESNGGWNAFEPVKSDKYTYSSLCQGLAVSLLVRAYKETSSSLYLSSAKSALDFLLRPIPKGGTTFYGDEGEVIFEEYINYLEYKTNPVLNGWIFALFGLYDYYLTTKDQRTIAAFNSSIDTLVKYLPLYDTGYWTKYNLRKIASPHYHTIHISLVNVLYEITNRDEFRAFHDKWIKYRKNHLYKSLAFSIKVMQKIFENTDAVVLK